MTTGNNQYSETEITDFYLDLAKFPTATELLDGRVPQYIVVEPRYEYRMDLLSYNLYGNSKYWWVIALLNRNQIQDPIRDLRAGMQIRVLAPGDIKRIV